MSAEAPLETEATGVTPEVAAAEALQKLAQKQEGRRTRTAQLMFRLQYREQLELTSLADSKANMMIQINGLIMSILLASSTVIVNPRPWLWLPCGALSITSLVSIVFAVLAARPELRKPARITVDDVHSGRANILFFGNFGRISEDDYVAGMSEMFDDQERVHLNMTRHVYGMGNVLLRKFRLLRVSYTAFLAGLLLSCALFLISLAALWGGP